MFRTKIGEGLGKGCIQKSWDPYLFLQPLKLATSNLVYNLGLGLSYQKQRLGPKLAGGGGSGPGEHPKKIGTPCLFLQPLKLATETLVHNMSSGLPCLTQVLFREGLS